MDELREMVKAIEAAGFSWGARWWPSREQWYVDVWKKPGRDRVGLKARTRGPKAFEAFGDDLVELTRQVMVRGLQDVRECDTVAE